MAFRPVKGKAKVPADPIELFNDLRPRKIPALYDQQAQLLRDYHSQAKDEMDVAIQGATGSGKTLVGLLIAEWRRQRGERVVYLCPTRQLAHQVSNFAAEQLGLPTYPFVGSRTDFPRTEKTGWKSGSTLAVATYSALFNINPFFSDPNFILVDDAHAADQYISSFWSVSVERGNDEQQALFEAIVGHLGDALPSDEIARLSEASITDADDYWVQLVPATELQKVEHAISAELDQYPPYSQLGFRWQSLKGNLRACQMYVSPREILIRPLLPPTHSHQPFAGATQRLFMSATLGRGGELERLSGRKKIKRLPSPPGWDGHGVGRRFFMFPGASLDEEQEARLFVLLSKETGRSLYLVPAGAVAERLKEGLKSSLPGFQLFSAREIEQSKDPFINSKNAIAIIANRYDGIDFPDDDCRLLVVGGRPSGASLQERFLADKLGARALFAERVRTRIVQAFGRCTRSANDYAIVVVTGSNLMDELIVSEGREALDRELQAEIRFGEEQSKDRSVNGFIELAELFLDQGDEWRDAEAELASIRDDQIETAPIALNELQSAAYHEVEYIERMWAGDYFTAYGCASQVLEKLAGGDELLGYRAMWQYLAGCAAHFSASENGNVTDPTAVDHFGRARSMVGTRWLGKLATVGTQDALSNSAPIDQQAIEHLEAKLCDLGLTMHRKFSNLAGTIRSGIQQNDAKPFEAAQVQLGNLLGFRADNSSSEGAPDPWWIAGNELCIVFEDHSDGTSGNTLDLAKARQAASHHLWIEDNVATISSDTEIISVLVTPCDTDKESHRTNLREVVVWPLVDFRQWTRKVLDEIQRLRSQLKSQGDLVWRAEANARLAALHATPTTLAEFLRDRIGDHD